MRMIVDVVDREEFHLHSMQDGTAVLTIHDDGHSYEIRLLPGEVLAYISEWLMLSHLQQTVEPEIPF